MKRFRKKIFKSTKGITLIALVVTIIILLLLAGVSIAMLTGNNGILTQGQRAKEETRIAGVEEVVKLYKQGKYIDSTTGSVTENANEMLENLKGQKLVSEDEIDRENEIITIKRKDGSIAKEIQYGMVTITISKTPENEKARRITLKVESVEGIKIPIIRNQEDFFNFINNLSDDEKKDLIRSMYPNFVNKMTQNSENPTNFKTLNDVISYLANNNSISENSESAFWNGIEQERGINNLLYDCIGELCWNEETHEVNGCIITNPNEENSDTYIAKENGEYSFTITDRATGREYKRKVNVNNIVKPQKGTLAYMYEKAEEEGCTNSDGSCTNAEHLHIGDYVNYNPLNFKEGTLEKDKTASSSADENGSKDQTFSINTDTKWRVLGEDDYGQILIVSADPVKKDMGDTNNPYFYLYGAKGYINAEKELEKISKIYSHGVGATGAKSLKIEDVNKICGVTVGRYGLTPDVDERGNFGTTYSCTDEYASPEDYLEGKRSNFSKTSDAYYYEGNNSLLKTATNTRAYETIFFKKQIHKYNWLASRSVDMRSPDAYFCIGGMGYNNVGLYCGMFSSMGDQLNVRYGGVRPVISLKSDITTEVISKIEDQEEQDWSGFSEGEEGSPTVLLL